MLENRSFDRMPGFLYANQGNVSTEGQPFEGLTGKETNPDGKGDGVKVFKILPTDPIPIACPVSTQSLSVQYEFPTFLRTPPGTNLQPNPLTFI
jgi:hypothetical protein